MGILDNYKRRESERIEHLYKKADCMTEDQLNDLIKYVFKSFYDLGFAGQATAKSLILKINKVLKIHYVPGAGEFDKWHKEFCGMAFEVKKSLLVTMANDLCRMSIFTEKQIMEKIDHFLKDIPGVMAGSRELK